eukprot:scaffold1401_cov330-Pavlova_lutheri.AAC.74
MGGRTDVEDGKAEEKHGMQHPTWKKIARHTPSDGWTVRERCRADGRKGSRRFSLWNGLSIGKQDGKQKEWPKVLGHAHST